VITGNFSNDLTLLVKAAREVGFEGKFYTFYGNALGAPAAMGEAGIGRCWPWPTGTPTCPGGVRARPSTRVPCAFPKPATTTCTCACS
jgi:branched-chain amino acid transport system substrate-binding protein